ncbi:hypothetical protein SAMN04487944_11056 [Gracilibacillus ureilyticus]|uniref:Coat F domain-containing protein n=1 Tax=Gracilibacillus ureilyticus TaxID=531814 RepID=A0A1H9S1S0_9BACI|nr:hypothetical protein [Gracilibacillus ureilyticus]SER78970.1 hypothetical protein SAMN04487944_11056 [Gracilibacillus ureilyticus]
MQQEQHTGSQTMPQPPAMISTKDHLYLTDMLSWNLNAAKKAHFFAQFCTIPEVNQAIEKVCQMHEKHYQLILEQLNSQNKQTM